MNEVSKERKTLFNNLKFSTFANAALSTRMNFEPERLFLSGIQTYLDIVQLVADIKNGKNRHIDENAIFDFLGYSMGALLAELLVMTNHKKYFENSKLLLVAGGSILQETYPTSKAILDSEAVKVLKEYYTIDFESNLAKNNHLLSVFEEHPEIGFAFKAMLSHDLYENRRYVGLRKLNGRIRIISFQKDEVFPVKGLKESLKSIDDENYFLLDFDYDYSHEKLFFENCLFDDKVDLAFEQFIKTASEFLRGSRE